MCGFFGSACPRRYRADRWSAITTPPLRAHMFAVCVFVALRSVAFVGPCRPFDIDDRRIVWWWWWFLQVITRSYANTLTDGFVCVAVAVESKQVHLSVIDTFEGLTNTLCRVNSGMVSPNASRTGGIHNCCQIIRSNSIIPTTMTHTHSNHNTVSDAITSHLWHLPGKLTFPSDWNVWGGGRGGGRGGWTVSRASRTVVEVITTVHTHTHTHTRTSDYCCDRWRRPQCARASIVYVVCLCMCVRMCGAAFHGLYSHKPPTEKRSPG